MDFFGIGTAIGAVIRVYFMAARATGRTTSLVEGVKDGDRVVFTNGPEAERVQKLCLSRGIMIKYIVVDPRKPKDIFQYRTSPKDGRTIFDHTWLEEFYLHRLKDAQEHLAHLEKELSGYGATHRENKQVALERKKWRL